jgi:UDP-4-amino-4,6-dideoxy-N-acetyl-beta-L-altrosamine transaminase
MTTRAVPTLAIEGGTPVRATRLPYGRQQIDDADVAAVGEALRSDFLTTGPRIESFERAFAAYVGAKHAIAVNSGTAALHAAAFAAGIEPGTDAITTSLTFAATANCVRYLGGRVLFADVRPDILTLSPDATRKAMTPATRAVLAVDYTGEPADLDELKDIAAANGALLIEDACHALGAVYRGRRVGQIADLTVFSLHPVKHVTSGEGGVVTTDRDDLASALRMFRTHGISTSAQTREREGSWFYEMQALGFNYRITDFQCALAESQLRKADKWLARRRAIAAQYHDAFRDLDEITTPAELPDREHAWHLYVIRLSLEKLRAGRGEIFKALHAENIGVNVHYIPVTWHPYYQSLGYAKGLCPTAEDAYERMLTIPLFPSMTDQDVGDVVTAVRKVIRHYAR